MEAANLAGAGRSLPAHPGHVPLFLQSHPGMKNMQPQLGKNRKNKLGKRKIRDTRKLMLLLRFPFSNVYCDRNE